MDIMKDSFSYHEPKEYTLDDKIQMIGLSEERGKALKKLQAQEIDFDYNEHLDFARLEMINCNDIVGTIRFSKIPWMNILDKKLHKMRNFENFNEKAFRDFIISEQEPLDGYPEVVRKDGKYYIAGNGLHRLTIAKCIGNVLAFVVVKDF